MSGQGLLQEMSQGGGGSSVEERVCLLLQTCLSADCFAKFSNNFTSSCTNIIYMKWRVSHESRGCSESKSATALAILHSLLPVRHRQAQPDSSAAGCPCELRLVCFVATSVCNSAVRWFPSNLCGRRAGLIKNCCDGVNTCASEMSQAKFSVNLLQPQNHGTNHTWQAHMPPHLAIVFPETQSHNPVSGAYESLLCLATIMF